VVVHQGREGGGSRRRRGAAECFTACWAASTQLPSGLVKAIVVASPWYFTTAEVGGEEHDEVRPSVFNGLLGGALVGVGGNQKAARRMLTVG
jgi:hypothetical protein